jgi:DeoR/GlpR family transcriptional regulator of sugar metabolism
MTFRHRLDTKAMLASERQALILQRARESGIVSVSELIGELGVSDMTIRRDLDALNDRGLVERVYGGAVVTRGRSLFEPSFQAKLGLHAAEKEAIAEAAATFVEPNTLVGISAGTTGLAVARRLVDVPGLIIVTNSISVAEVIREAGREDQRVILTGGEPTPSNALVGPFAVWGFQQVHLDVVFLGVHGMTSRSGYATPNLLEAEANRALVEAGRTLIVVADHTKWGVIGLSTIAPLDQADVLITDEGLDAAGRSVLEEAVRRLTIVPPRSRPEPMPRAAAG